MSAPIAAPALTVAAPPPSYPFDELLAAFKRHLRLERGLAANTIDSYTLDLRRFGVWLEREHVAALELMREHANAYVDQLAGEGLGPASIRRHTASLRAFYHWLLLEERLRVDPTAKLPTPALGRSLPRSLRQIEVAQLLAAPEGDSPRALRDRALLELTYACGLRVSEVAQLALGDLDLGAAELRVRGKGGRERLALIGRGAIAALSAYLAKGRPRLARSSGERALFLSRQGRGMTRQGVARIMGGHARRAGLARFTPHMIRHAFGTHLVQGGADVRGVQILLGHASLDTTAIYTSLVIDDLREAFYRAHPRARIEQEGSP